MSSALSNNSTLFQETINLKSTPATPEVLQYIAAQHSGAEDALLRELRAETAGLGGISEMQISGEQGTLLSLLAAASGARTAIEVGSFTGYSAICIARGLPPDGRLLCCDRSEEWTGVARRYWERAGVADKIELRLGSAADTLRALEAEARFDLAFIDADKTGYDEYYELILPRLKPNGLLLFDNMLRGGRVAAPDPHNPDDVAIDALNRKLARDPRVEAVLLPVADGIQLCRKI